MGDRIVLTIPADPRFRSVATLVIGGIGSRADLPYERTDDLQLAVLSALDASSSDDVTVEVDTRRRAPRGRDSAPSATGSGGDPALARVLSRLVDEVSVRAPRRRGVAHARRLAAARLASRAAPDALAPRSPRRGGPSTRAVRSGRCPPAPGSRRDSRRSRPEAVAPARTPFAGARRRATPRAPRSPGPPSTRPQTGTLCGSRSFATTWSTRSRSVTIPTSFSPSTTGSEPTSSDSIRRAASTTSASLAIAVGPGVMTSFTAVVAIVSLLFE